MLPAGWLRATGVVAATCLLAPAAHALALLALAALLGMALSSSAVIQSLAAGGADQVYTSLALATLGGITANGLILRFPAADWLNVGFAAGSSAIGLQVAQLLLNMAFVALGAGLLTLAIRSRRLQRWQLRFAGLACAALGVGAELLLQWTRGSGGDITLSMVATKLLHASSDSY
ncbi:MAG TPA: hypothetical protein VKU60_16070, partial [Chloroflexota bacterium]|nr:hypothetical protein [Chloroflexota bacterium]